MKLNYRIRVSKNTTKTILIVMVHGLFGNLNNLEKIAKYLIQYYDIIQVDLRNHGRSSHNPIMTYIAMAQDILDVLDYLSIQKCVVVGHSMGGKIAMMLSMIATQRINKIIVIDIAPKTYKTQKHNNIFHSINYINQHNVQDKNDVFNIMQKNHIKKNIISFLLKSFYKGSWRFNFDIIEKNYELINSWTIHQTWKGPILFIKGELSSYINQIDIKNIYKQFPNACIQTVPNAGHWVHYEYPTYVFNIIHKFLCQ